MSDWAQKRVAIFFNHQAPNATGHHLFAALRGLCIVDLYLPHEASTLKPYSHDLYLCVDDSTHYLFPQRLKPSVFWLIESHLSYKADRIMSGSFDYIFAALKDGVEQLKRSGLDPVWWLPLAHPASQRQKLPAPRKYDIAFVGGECWGYRRRLLETIKKRFINSYFGRASFSEMIKIYQQSKIVFNISIKQDINMRIFEGMGSGACLVTNADACGLRDLFTPGQHLLAYNSPQEAIALIDRYLQDDVGRHMIAAAGETEVFAKHTYDHRARRILDLVFEQERILPRRHTSNFLRRAWDGLCLNSIQLYYKVLWRVRPIWDRARS